MARAAARRGLREIAITDHGPNALVIGIKRRDIDELEREIAEISGRPIQVLFGIEANVISMDGDIDVPRRHRGHLQWLTVGLHPYSISTSLQDGYRLFGVNHLRHLGRWARQQAINNNTKAVIAALDKNRVDVVSHPGLFFTVDVEEVARACVRNHTYFEINCGHEWPPLGDIIEADRAGAQFIAGSDAHQADRVGNLDYALRAAEKLRLDPAKMMNLGGEEALWERARKI
jgi:putative hydrolase